MKKYRFNWNIGNWLVRKPVSTYKGSGTAGC